ncbi:hypothetical protein DL98DRAFT_639151 [Cadophora sp. DSE1049]|nr:hypothetical protein DL98DRAFT_639151 [Cadophora sp. DSE1049]
MANFDVNRWHQITIPDNPKTASMMAGGFVFNKATSGLVMFFPTETSNKLQQWQIFRYNSTFYVLRTEGSGSLGYSGVQFDKEEETPGKTIPVTRNVSVSDDSMFWRIGPWGDGTFWLSNGANGSEWRLTVKVPFTGVAMSSNITAPQDGQRFSFEQSDPIDDVAYSSVIVSPRQHVEFGIFDPAELTCETRRQLLYYPRPPQRSLLLELLALPWP